MYKPGLVLLPEARKSSSNHQIPASPRSHCHLLLLLPNHTATSSFQSPKVVHGFLCTHFLYIFIFSFTHAVLPLMSGSSTPVTGAAVEQFFLMW